MIEEIDKWRQEVSKKLVQLEEDVIFWREVVTGELKTRLDSLGLRGSGVLCWPDVGRETENRELMVRS